MKTYHIYFRSDLQWGRQDIDAETPAQALALARRRAQDIINLKLDYYEPFDNPINEIEVCDDEHSLLAEWQDDDLRLRLAAGDLLEALRFCGMTLADLEASERKGYIQQAKRIARTAIAKATGGAA